MSVAAGGSLGARIRPAVRADAEALAYLHLDVWEDAYAGLIAEQALAERRSRIGERIERWRKQLDDPSVRTLVAENETGLVGFASAGPPRDDDVSTGEELWALYVRASWWGTGIGHALLVAALGESPAYLWVLKGNERAIAFYRKHGFTEDGVTRSEEFFGPQVRMAR